MMIRLENITKRFADGQRTLTVLDGLSLTVEEGEFIAITGESGAGKTTLLNILGTFMAPDEGELTIKNEKIKIKNEKLKIKNEKIKNLKFRKLKKLMKLKKLKDDTFWMHCDFSPQNLLQELLSFIFPKRAWRANSFNFFNFHKTATSETYIKNKSEKIKNESEKLTIKNEKLIAERLCQLRNLEIGFVYQDHRLLPQFTVWQNILLPTLATKRASTEEERQRALDLLDFMGIAELKDSPVTQLSGGEQTRVAICRALINQPSILLADEPTGQLDAANAQTIATLFQQVNAQLHTTIIMVTHSAEMAKAAQKVFQLKEGKLTPA